MPWNPNSDLFFFHGTDSAALAAYTLPRIGDSVNDGSGNLFRPDLAQCRVQTDFGRGFYVTSSLRQAKEWANEVVLKSVAKGLVTSRAIVLRFVLSREKKSIGESHSFISETVDYYDFTDQWRRAIPGTVPHGRTTSHLWVNHATGTPSITSRNKTTYDFVHGPVRLNRQHIILQNCDQLSLHTDTALDAIADVLLEAEAPPGTAAAPSAFTYP